MIITDRAAARLDDMLDDVRTLVEVESPSQDLEAVRRSAEAVQTLIKRRLTLSPVIDEASGVAFVRWRPKSPRILILAHHDTVWPIGTLEQSHSPCETA